MPEKATSGKLHVKEFRSQLGRVRGPGTARSGVHHWRSSRLSSIALIPLTLWFIFSVLRLVGVPQEAVAHWAARPVNTVLMLALIATTFYHTSLGLQVILEDYVHDRRFAIGAMLAQKAACWLLGLLAAVSVLKLALQY